MEKLIGCIYKYDQWKLPYSSLNTTFVLPNHSETSIQTQHTYASDSSVGAHYLASSVSDQSTIHHGNTDVNDDYDLQSFEARRKNNLSFFVLVIESP